MFLICLSSSSWLLTLLDHALLVLNHLHILFCVFFSSLTKLQKTIVYANGSAQTNYGPAEHLAGIKKQGPNSIVKLAKAIPSNF